MTNDFSKGSVKKNIVSQAIPLVLAQLTQLMYNVVDRIYIGHLPDAESMALTGLGLVFPITMLIAAFTNLFGTGGTPLFAIARGAKEEEKACKILGNTFSLLLCCSVILTVLCFVFRKPVLFLFGASDDSYVYADDYLKIYLMGTPFLMLSTGLNGFINAQGFPQIGMLTTIIGAGLNIALDPLFIIAFDMGISGAAIATVISQAISAVWVIKFLTGKKALLKIQKEYLKIDWRLAGRIATLGLSGFIVQGTNCAVLAVCNSMLKTVGGDLYIGIMTVISSVRDILHLPVQGITHGAQPVLGYNYGAREYDRVKQGIRFMAFLGFVYTAAAWLFVLLAPEFLISVFTDDVELIENGVSALHIYFFGFIFMALQFTGQSTFQALGYSGRAIFFSLFRKAIIVIPLTIILPQVGFGVDGIFLAEPISNAIGGIACFTTMYFTVYRRIGKNSV